MNPFHLNTLSTSELLRVVDRSNPEVRELAKRLETVIALNKDFCAEVTPFTKAKDSPDVVSST